MKRILLFLTCMLMLFGIGWAEEGITKSITFSSANTVTENPLEISFAKNSGTTTPAYNGGIRLYYDSSSSGNGCSMTISQSKSATTNIAIKKVVFTYTGSSNTFPSGAVTVGTLSTSGTIGTWVAPQGQNINSIEFKNTNTSNVQVRFTKVDITYDEVSSEPDPDDNNFTEDVINNANTYQNTGSTYKSFDNVLVNGHKYFVHCAGGNSLTGNNTPKTGPVLQLRNGLTSNTQHAGIVSTTSGGKVAKITFTFNPGTTINRSVGIYASNTPYTNPNELYENGANQVYKYTYNSSGQTITETYEFDTDYEYVGLCALDGALYLDEVRIYWAEKSSTPEPPVIEAPNTPVVKIGDEVLDNNGEKIVASNTIITISCDGATSVTGVYEYEEGGEDPLTFTGDQPYTYTINESGMLTISGTNEGGESEEFEYYFTIGEVDPNMPAVGSNFKQLLNGDAIEAGYYVMASGNAGADSYAMSVNIGINQNNNNVTSTKDVSVVDAIGEGRSRKILTTTSEEVMILKIETEDEQIGIKTVNFGDKFKTSQGYLFGSDATGTNLNVVKSEELKPAFIELTSLNNDNANIRFAKDDTRKVVLANNTNWFNYQSSGNTIQLYKLTDKKPFALTLEDKRLQFGKEEEYEIILPEGEKPEINFTKDGDCILLDGTTITAKAPGEATITASWVENEEWFGGSASFTVTVLPEQVQLNSDNFYFRWREVRGKKGVGVNAQAVYYAGNPEDITYSISREGKEDVSSEILIDSKTGMIRPGDLINPVLYPEYYTVKATAKETDYFSEGEASYTIIIEEPDAASTGDLVENFYNGKKFIKDGEDYELKEGYTTKETIFTSKETGIEYTAYNFQKGQYENKYYSIVLRYDEKSEQYGYLSFTLPANTTSIKLKKGKQSGVSTPNVKMTVGEDLYEFTLPDNSEKDEESYYTQSFSGKNYGTTTKVTIEPDGKPLYIEEITFSIPESDKPEIGISFTNSGEGEERYFNLYAEEDTKLPFVLEHNKAANFMEDIILDIDEMDEEDNAETYQGYTITGNDWDDISVNITYPGVYTFRAEYNAEKLVNEGKLDKVENAKFLNGMAILRLNVFPRLNVLPSDEHDSALADDERTDAPELTLVQPVINDEGQQEAMITLPSLAQLGDDYKYSTVNISLEIKRGTDAPETYKFINGKYYKDGEVDTEPLDESIKFTEDGYVKYILKYADTEDFQIASTVHVILMPQTMVNRSEDNKITLAPSQNATLKYAFVYGNGKNDVKRRVTEIPENDWETATEGMTFDDVEALKNEGVTAIFYKSEKDLGQNQAMIEDNAVPANPILSDDGVIVLAVTNVTLNMGEDQSVPFKTDSHTYSLADIFSFTSSTNSNLNLEEGKDFNVTVKALGNAEGWEATTASTKETLNAAYEQVFATMQKNDGLYNQYLGLDTEYVDGFFTGVTNVSVTADKNEGSFTVSADLPCSGVYEVTVSPIDGSEYTFDEEKVQLTVTPNLYGTFGTDNGFNIEGYTFEKNGDKYYIYFPKQVGEDEDYEFTENMICYIPGTYFVSSLQVTPDIILDASEPSVESLQNVKRAANNKVYFASVDLSGMNNATTEESNVKVTVTKNGASADFTFYLAQNADGNVSTGVEEIEGAEEGEAIYFTIDGVRVQNPEKGIYIKVVGNKATKELL